MTNDLLFENSKPQLANQTLIKDLHHQDLQIIENAIMEEDLRNKTRTGRQSLILQPQPESKILKEYRIRKTMGNIFEDTRFSETISETSANLSTTSQHGNFLSEVNTAFIN